MPRWVTSERERRARTRVDKGERVNWLAVGPQMNALRLAERERREEVAAAEENIRRIAERDAKIAAKYGGRKAWQKIYDGSPDEHRRLLETIKANPELPAEQAQVAAMTAMGLEREAEEKRQAALDDQANELINVSNRRRQKGQKGKPPNRLHPIVKQEIIPERRLERELNPKPRKPAEDSWKTKLTAGRHWQDALRRFKMTPTELAAEDAAIEIAVNTEIEFVAQALANQAELDELAASGKLEQMDFLGYVWPTDEN